jgi:hypothetical protein
MGHIASSDLIVDVDAEEVFYDQLAVTERSLSFVKQRPPSPSSESPIVGAVDLPREANGLLSHKQLNQNP